MRTLNTDFYCRKATPADPVEKIAEYIHLTDPYIYPSICTSPNDIDWQNFILDCTLIDNNVYNIKNIVLLFFRNEIIGIACIIPCGKQLTITENITVPDSLTLNMQSAINGYFDPLIDESLSFSGYNIVNFCIDKQYRNQGLGNLLMEYCVREYGRQNIHLDVIASNSPAVALYRKFGFCETETYMGFSGDGFDIPCYHMIRFSDKKQLNNKL